MDTLTIDDITDAARPYSVFEKSRIVKELLEQLYDDLDLAPNSDAWNEFLESRLQFGYFTESMEEN